MEDFSQRIRHDAKDLRELSEEVCEQIEDAREEIIEEIEEAEWRWHHIENRLSSLRGKVKVPVRDVAQAVDTVADELHDTFRNIRRLWR